MRPATDLAAILRRYDYRFPPSLVARAPASPRDGARLLAYRRSDNRTRYGRFLDLPDHLPAGAVLVFNQTRVIPARLVLTKETGGRVEILYIGADKGRLKVMADRRLSVGSSLRLGKKIGFRVSAQTGKYYFLKPSFPISDTAAVLEKYGLTPLPPYIKDSPLSEGARRRGYQAIFARYPGSVAAPTASLHFTGRLLRKLRNRGFDTRFVTLHVGLGTFAPLTEENIRSGRLHQERYEIDGRTAAFLNAAKSAGRPIIAVGTTVARTLESAADKRGRLRRLAGATDLFIRDDHRFVFIDGLITNFHVPRSSLMMLVAAFVGRDRLMGLYRRAIARRFRLFSFGDGMLIV